MEKCYTLQVRALRVDYHVYFGAIGNVLYERCGASMTQPRQQSMKVRAKGIEPIYEVRLVLFCYVTPSIVHSSKLDFLIISKYTLLMLMLFPLLRISPPCCFV